MVLRLNVFRNLWPVGKHVSTRLMNALPILDLTFLLNGGLNPMTSLRLFFCFGGLSDNIDATLSFQCF